MVFLSKNAEKIFASIRLFEFLSFAVFASGGKQGCTRGLIFRMENKKVDIFFQGCVHPLTFSSCVTSFTKFSCRVMKNTPIQLMHLAYKKKLLVTQKK
jgi:hypothetical protein